MRSLPLMATCAVSLLLFASCGGDDDDAADDTTAVTESAAATTEAAAATTEAAVTTEAAATTDASTTTEEVETTDAATDSTEGAATGGEPDPATVEADVTEVFTAFFLGMGGTPEQLENGETYAEGLAQMATRETAADVSVAVNSVTKVDDSACDTAAVGAPCAEVNFDVLFEGVAAIPDNTGYAVYEDEQWKVSGATWCSLAVLSLPDAPGCV